MSAKHYFWFASNLYGYLFGKPWLAPLHRIFVNLSLHALGYDNARYTGEEWFIKRVLAKSDIKTAIDIGANVGNYSKLLATYLPATIYAVEPSSSSFKELKKTAATYPAKIKPINVAIADINGTGTLYSRAELSEKATLSKDLDKNSTLQETVQVKTLDKLADELSLSQIDFIKIDTEGHELEVFKGMKEVLIHFKPLYIQFEFNHVHLYRNVTLYQLTQLLLEYEFYRLLPYGWLKIDSANMGSNIFMFCNIIARRKPSNS